MDSLDLQAYVSSAIGWLSRVVPTLYNWLFAEHGGIANATLFLGLLTALVLLRKSYLQNRELRNRIDQQPLQAEKLRAETAKLSRDSVLAEIAANKDDFERIKTCASMIDTNSDELFRDLHKAFLPLVAAPDSTKWADRLGAIYLFRYEPVNRPKIEKAMEELVSLAERTGLQDPTIEELYDQAGAFLKAVSTEDCFIKHLAACAGTPNEELLDQIQKYVDDANEARRPLPALAGKVRGRAAPRLVTTTQ
jgi:hypothetical protein